MVEPEDELIMISANGVIIRISSEEVNLVTRPAKGVKVMRIKEDEDKVITLATIREEWEKQEIETDSSELDEESDETAETTESAEIEEVEAED